MTEEEMAIMYFEQYDVDSSGVSNGKLCLEEFQAFFIINCNQCPWDNAQRMLNFFDKDGDGCLNQEEFIDLYKHMNDETIPDEEEKDDETVPVPDEGELSEQ